MEWLDGAWLGWLDAATREAMLFAGMGLLIGGIDDLAVDLIWWARLLLGHERRLPRVADLMTVPAPPPRLAVFVPAWDEAEVIGAMLATARARWGAADYAILVGTYPNDPATRAAADAAAAGDPRIRIVTGTRPGPTTKADCLNTLWRALRADPALAAADAIVLHDAEDVVHPDELAVFAALIGEATVVQLPVVPLIEPGSWVSASYADDFAQSHSGQLVVRTALGAGMPLAGTGCAIRTDALARLSTERGGDGPFDPASLVEDYELGLRLAAAGGRGVFARVADARGMPVAVCAYFPATLGAAVRQKTRWITGIALAGWDRTGWARPLAFIDHWFRGRDRRTPLAMLVVAAAWLAVALWLTGAAAHFALGSTRPPLPPAIAALTGANAALLAWRLAMRALFTARLHGWRQGLAAMPRMLVGNLVALLATARAIGRYAAMLRGAPPAWDKTAHCFPATIP